VSAPDDPDKNFDRMSLNSLKRELEVQKSRTELEREEARQRISIAKKTRSGPPWKLIGGLAAAGLIAVLLLGIFGQGLVRSMGVELPEFIASDLPEVPEDYVPVEVPAVPDAGPVATETERGPRRPPTKRREDLDRLDLGDTNSNDPLEGL
jgi:hypothetical protein